MSITVVDQLHGPAADEAWALYRAAFADLAALAVQRHLMFRKEFDEVCDDRRVGKYLSHDGATLQGLATFTNHLDAMPLISPQYFQRRWPQHYAEGRVWYCGFVAVHPDHRASGAFAELVHAMWQVAADQQGIIGLDVCGYNDDRHRLSRVIGVMLDRLAGRPVVKHADVQTFRIYETSGTS